MDFQKIIDRAMHIRGQYEAKEQHQYGSAWTSEEIALGFVGDVGDLAKLIVAENGRRNIANSKEKLEHELSDCLWSVIVLSRLHDTDLESSFICTMDELKNICRQIRKRSSDLFCRRIKFIHLI
jgi:NTP pyrophosphatase (non-canonical NTP hydrolase)